MTTAFEGIFPTSPANSSLFFTASETPKTKKKKKSQPEQPPISPAEAAPLPESGAAAKSKKRKQASDKDSTQGKAALKKQRSVKSPDAVASGAAAGGVSELPAQQRVERSKKQAVSATAVMPQQPGEAPTPPSGRRTKLKTLKTVPAQPRQQSPQPDQHLDPPEVDNSAEQPAEAVATGIEQAADHTADDQLDRTIFVGNLRATTKPKALKQLFSRYGAVDTVRLRSVPVKLDAAMPRRAAVLRREIDAERATAHAYVVFAAPEQAQAALGHNMQVVDNLHIRVDMATAAGAGGTAGSKSYNRARSVFVGNLSFAVQDEDLVRFFSDGKLDPELDGAVTAVRVVRDSKTNIGKGIAFVEFKSKAAAAAAMRLAEPKLGKRTMRLSFLKQPKAMAAAAPVATLGAAKGKGSRAAAGRIQQRQTAAKDKAAAPSWMGEKTRGPGKLCKGPRPVVSAKKAGFAAAVGEGKGKKPKAKGSYKPRASKGRGK